MKLKNYKSDFDGELVDDENQELVTMERDNNLVLDQYGETLDKHAKEKSVRMENLKSTMFPKMRYYLDCGFNLLVYGVGSKRGFLKEFSQLNISNASEPLIYVNGYNTGANIKSIISLITKFMNEHILRRTGQTSSKKFNSVHD